jgi:hypothetical protein
MSLVLHNLMRVWENVEYTTFYLFMHVSSDSSDTE